MGRSETRYDRALLLEQAARARARRQWRRAIALYRHVLALERSCVEIHERLAPLLAETGQEFDAWVSYRTLAHAALRQGREDRAIAVFREAARAVPREIQAWQGLARLLVRQSEDEDAIEVLIEGSRQFRAHWSRPQAIHLLRRARAIEPWHFETVLELARHLGRCDQRVEARMLLEGLAERCHGPRLRRVRAAQLAVTPGPRALLAWLAALLQRAEPEPETGADPLAWSAGVVPIRSAPALSDLPMVRETRPGAPDDAEVEAEASDAPASAL